jgi:APA family basic amino acid/polyamine antiporter
MNETDNQHRSSPGLIRGLGLWGGMAVVIGSMIGQAIFLVANDMARELGSPMKVLLLWTVGGIVVLFGALCYAELGAAMPEAGGDYVYLGRGLSQLWSFLFGWWHIRLPLLHTFVFTISPSQPFAVTVIALVTALNYFAVKTVGHFQIVLTGAKIVALAAIVLLGLLPVRTIAIQSQPFPVPPHGPMEALLIAVVPAMLAYNGFQFLGNLGGEIASADRNLPRALILGTAIVIVLYTLITWTYFHILGLSAVARSEHVASDALTVVIGAVGAKWLTIFMIVSAFGALHANFLSGPRVPYAMALEGTFFSFGKYIHPVFHTPTKAIILHASIATALVLTGTYQELYAYDMFATWAFFPLTVAALFRLRRKLPALPRPYRVWGYPWTPLIFAVVALAISFNLFLLRPIRSSIGLGIILLGIPLFRYLRKRTLKISAAGASS